jgi:biopolymer transport protein ExbB
MNAFQAMGQTGSAGIGAISAGISEALITTAFGLFVAVPALWAHNSLADRAGRLEREAERVARELTDGLVQVG